MNIEGKKIVKVRKMTTDEHRREGWQKDGETIVLELSDGTLIYPSRDAEGNNSGVLFGADAEGKNFFTLDAGSLTSSTQMPQQFLSWLINPSYAREPRAEEARSRSSFTAQKYNPFRSRKSQDED